MMTNPGFVEILNSVSLSLFAINGTVAYNMFQRCKREIMATRPSCRNRIVEFCWQLVVIEMWFAAFEAWIFFLKVSRVPAKHRTLQCTHL